MPTSTVNWYDMSYVNPEASRCDPVNDVTTGRQRPHEK